MLCSQYPAGCTQQVCSASPCLLGSVLPFPLPCCVDFGGCSQPTVTLPPKPPLCYFSASCIEQTQGTCGRKGWEIKSKAQYSSWGTSPESRHKTHCGTQDSVYLLPISWAPKWIFTQTCASVSLHLDQRPSAKVALDKQLAEQGQALSNVPGNRT